MLEIVVFSRDRACQLDLMLRTLQKNLRFESRISCIFMATNDLFLKGYMDLIQKHKYITWIFDTDFKSILLFILNKSTYEYITFFVDDIVIVNPIEQDKKFEKFAGNPRILSLNLRLSPVTLYNCFEIDGTKIGQPEIDGDGIYDWASASNVYWGHPFTTCGFIFRREDVVRVLQNSCFFNPNTMEDVMTHSAPVSKPLCICYDKPKMVELCINLVNETHTTNIHGDTDPGFLNAMWLDGFHISEENLVDLDLRYQRFPNFKPVFMKG